MNFSEQPPSKQWAALTFRGERVAEVWFKPEGEPFALWVRIPRRSFQIPGIRQRLTPEYVLRGAGISATEVEFWRYEGAPDSGASGSASEFGLPFPPPPPNVTHLNLYVSLKPPPAVAPPESDEPEAQQSVTPEDDHSAPEDAPPESDEPEAGESEAIESGAGFAAPNDDNSAPEDAPPGSDEPTTPEARWQYLDARWEAILVVEANVDSLRLSMDGLRIEMEAAAGRSLTLEEKVNAVSADMVLWNKAKNRIRYALPKLRESIHRATWAKGTAERKTVEELFTNHVQPRIPTSQLDQIRVQFDSLLKSRQVLSAQSTAVHQECRRILSEVDGALRTLQRNSAANAARKKSAGGKRGKFT